MRAYSSKGCFHGASILDLQKGVCHAAANDHHVHLQPLRSSSICPLEQQVLHNEEMKKKDHITCKPKELVAKMHCVIFFGAHAAEKKSTKQLSALSSMFMISWILSLTCTFGCLSGHVILICFPDLSKPKRFRGMFIVFLQVHGSNSRQQNTTLLCFSIKHTSANHNIAIFHRYTSINTVNEI